MHSAIENKLPFLPSVSSLKSPGRGDGRVGYLLDIVCHNRWTCENKCVCALISFPNPVIVYGMLLSYINYKNMIVLV